MKKIYKIASGISTATALLLALIIYLIYQDYLIFLADPLGQSDETLSLTIEPGSGYSNLEDELSSRGLLEHPAFLKWYVKSEKLGHRIKAGKYYFESMPTPVQLMDRLVSGKVIQHRLTIPEGWSFREMLAAIHKHPSIVNTIGDASNAEIMKMLAQEDQHPEGMFYPDTYQFPDAITDLEFLQRANKTMLQILQEEWQNRGDKIQIETPYEALVLASIIEKETGVAHERSEISGVFNRRLAKGMRLQTDPTVIYGMGDQFDGNIRRKDLRTDTPYNTYTRKGLPPTPIALPGRAAIHAALHPKDGNTLYFVAKGDGSHYFSATLQEHNRAVAKYQLRKK